MKAFFSFTIILVLLSCSVVAQKQTADWETQIIVEYPDSSIRDTIVIGLDSSATHGYDPAFDIIDTSFSYPLAIRGANREVSDSLQTCPGVMKRDIRPFDGFSTVDDTIRFEFYVKADTFPYERASFDEFSTKIIIDSSIKEDFIDSLLEVGYFYSRGGYMDGIDGTRAFLFGNDLNSDHFPNIPLIYEDGNYGSCFSVDQVMGFTFEIYLYDTTSIGIKKTKIKKSQFQVINFPGNNWVLKFLNQKEGSDFQYSVFDLMGREIRRGSFNRKLNLNLNHLPNQLFILSIRKKGKGKAPVNFKLK